MILLDTTSAFYIIMPGQRQCWRASRKYRMGRDLSVCSVVAAELAFVWQEWFSAQTARPWRCFSPLTTSKPLNAARRLGLMADLRADWNAGHEPNRPLDTRLRPNALSQRHAITNQQREFGPGSRPVS